MTEAEMKQEIAVLLFQKEKFTLGQASRFAGMNRVAFQHLLASRQISIHYDVEDFEQDVKNLREMGRLRSLLEKKTQVELGSGDYTQERKDVLDSGSRDDFWQDLQRIRDKKIN